MASTMIHIAISSEINKKLKRNNDKFLIGSIAPDLSKFLGETKVESHFLDNEDDDVPNIERFLAKYRDKLNDDFVLGYFVHLYTDFLWFKYFVPEIYEENYIKKLDGTNVKCIGNMLIMYIYNDYTNLNSKLIDEYDLDLSIFYKEPPKFNNIIQEIPMDKIKLIIDKASVIISNSKVQKDLVFNMDNIKKFIETSVDLILSKIQDLNLL